MASTLFLNTHFVLVSQTSDGERISLRCLPPSDSVTSRGQAHSREGSNDLANVRSIKERSSELDGIKILVAVASYDFSQIPHLEEGKSSGIALICFEIMFY